MTSYTKKMASDRANTIAICNEIITRVKANPQVWSYSHPLYKNRVVHKNFWQSTSKEMNVDENYLRKRWKHLKDQYRKELKRSLEKGIPDNIIGWHYFGALGFLKEEVLRDRSAEDRQPSASVKDESDDDETEEDETEEVATKVRIVEAKTDMIYQGLMETKAVIEERMNAVDDISRNDPDYMYLMSLLPTFKQLSEIQKLQLKGKINEWFLESYLEQCDTKFIVSDIQHVSVEKEES